MAIQIARAGLLNKEVESPALGFSKPVRVDDALAALDLVLSQEEMDYLEEPYLAHEFVGSIGHNFPRKSGGVAKSSGEKVAEVQVFSKANVSIDETKQLKGILA